MDTIISKARKMQNKLKIVESDLLKTHILLDQESDKRDKRDIQNLFVEAISYATKDGIASPFWFEKETTNKVLTTMKKELVKK